MAQMCPASPNSARSKQASSSNNHAFVNESDESDINTELEFNLTSIDPQFV